jgi:hypothetical protein
MQNEITDVLDRSDFDPTWTDHNGRRMGDPWGKSMGLFFNLCAYIHERTPARVPPAWQYRHGAGDVIGELKETRPALYEAFESADISTLLHTGHVLHRYTRALEWAGHSY